jgi:FixJ family two-component response regulator
MNIEPIIYIVDDDEVVRRSLEAVFASGSYRTSAFASAEELLRSFDGSGSGCLILDLRLKGKSGLELLSELRARGCDMPALMISGHADVPVAVRSMKLGAFDFIEKPVKPEVLLAMVEEALTNARAKELAQPLPVRDADRLSTLTPREMDILRHLVAGESSKQIAIAMALSEKTVSNHRAHLLAKTGAQNTAELVRIAVHNRIA